MFVRWAVRKRARYDGGLLIASLVESKRIGGKPRHRFVGYLGSIRVDFVDNPLSVLHRARFWDWAERPWISLTFLPMFGPGSRRCWNPGCRGRPRKRRKWGSKHNADNAEAEPG